jgi:hypothetical protein
MSVDTFELIRLLGSRDWSAPMYPMRGFLLIVPESAGLTSIPSNGHVTLAWGRDYGDVSPLHGLIQGGGANNLSVSVDVEALKS